MWCPRSGTAHADCTANPSSDPYGATFSRREKGSEGEVADIVNLLTVFMVVLAEIHESAVKIFEGHPHMTLFPCDGVEVMPVLGDS